ncbi:putative toxin-antitoxin system toxin component, PIN family [Candidatus Poribacteria bacterium]|nr:putative toxin-antitoxin system toxin component, PIN family [Candidatus Poribacteria bacterium]
MKEIKVVIDTNVFISSFFGGNPRKIIDLWKQSEIIICLSGEIINEYIEVLRRMGLENELKEILRLFAINFNSVFITKTPKLDVIKKDPDDNKFIECAVALDAKFIISGDKAVIAIKEYMGIKIVTPNIFLKIFTQAD